MNLLELCSEGRFQDVDLLLKSKHKGAAINATFEEAHVRLSTQCTCIHSGI